MANPQTDRQPERQPLHLHFGDYEIDLSAFELRRGGQPCAVEPQVLELLAYLVRNAGRLVTKADLIAHVWDGRIVSDSTLASRVKSARRAIGDDGEQQRLIKTVHSRGVRFVGEVRVELGPAEADGTAARPHEPAGSGIDIGAAAELPSIAVLPFANVCGDPEISYLVDGLTEDIITDLSRFRQLRVVARDSCFRHRDADLRAAAQTLGADYLVTGSVRRQGSRLRLSAQLTEAHSRNELWAERFDRSTEDVIAATDELVRTIVGTLAGRVRAALAKRKPPANFAAYDCVLRAQAALLKIGDRAAESEAKHLFQRALSLDADYPRAHAGLAVVLMRDWFRNEANAETAIERALDHAQRAVALDSDDNECQETLGWILLHRRSFDVSERHYRRAVELNPNSPDELAAMGSACSLFGRPDEGIGWFELAKKVDPYFDPSWYWNLLGATYFNARRYDDALAAFARNPNAPPWVEAYGAASHALAGRVEAARAAAAKLEQSAPEFSAADLIRKEPYKLTADLDHLAVGLRLAGLLPASADAPEQAAARSARQAPLTASTEAHQFYLMGRSFLISGGWGKRALEVARQMFVKAIEADPDFAHAYAALASCDCKRLLMEVESVSFQTIAAYSERALALQPGLCEAYAAKGMAHYAAGERAEADAAFEQAIARGPQCFEAHFFYGRHCLVEGRHEQAARLLERAAELNQNDYGALGLLDDCYRHLGRHDEARDAARRCVERVTAEVTAHPDNANALAFGAIMAAELGDDITALDWAGRAIAIDPADLVVNYNVACTYAALGELERAVARIRHAIPDDPVCRRAFTDWMKMDISLDPLRPLPEFQRLMHELEREFPDEQPKAMPLLQSA
ncbi:MAG TPA: tetratricopeptide repeat protein [Dongiaceae bacterium]|nr:tetratricopeptide repeat protein [Dongiaceae bacterium]